ncbi:hypothetical protein NP233_g8946 [Leucocoprinus birnbaumii]|uniref:NAD-dependent epimerase/dehydratase domain-containing protein n=1 Tax=Leucocoprinus birnbaumii TaxID=56174 RepID=A0AAD5YRC5_9AGAR|nr:hypothetical protein NP233_g8946 [Leucocoprinus birnbaumii]
MAIALPPAKVLVTGANGYLGMWIVRTLLEQGYSVRVTVRVASKGTSNGTLPSVFIKPAIQGTTGILQSAFEFGSNIKRVVITSSAAWKFYEKNKSKLNWDLTVVIPPVLLEPGIQEIPGGPSDLNASFKWLYESTLNTLAQTQEFLGNSSVWVDVRDAARGHMLALQKEDAGGECIIVSTGPFVWQDLADAASALNPWPLPNHPAPKGNLELERTYFTYFKTEKRERILGMVQSEMKTMEEPVKDALEDFAQRGW